MRKRKEGEETKAMKRRRLMQPTNIIYLEALFATSTGTLSTTKRVNSS
jgi:hypothetical protein